MYFVTVEIGQGIETSKKVGRVASSIGDLVTQESSVNRSQLEAIVKIGSAIIQPYARSIPDIVITGIQLSDQATPVAKVVWRYTVLAGKSPVSEAPASETTTVPPTLTLRNTFLVRVYTVLPYKPIIAWTLDQQKGLGIIAPLNGKKMDETYYFRGRMSATVPCTNC
jgi:Flp pilus assembly protein TadG